MRVELYLSVAEVTVSQNVAIRLPVSSGKCETSVTYMYATAGCLRVIRLIVLIVGDVYSMPHASQSEAGARSTSSSIAFRRSTSRRGMRTNMTMENGSRSCERSPRHRAAQAQRSENGDELGTALLYTGRSDGGEHRHVKRLELGKPRRRVVLHPLETIRLSIL
jgi:hypothetical protein